MPAITSVPDLIALTHESGRVVDDPIKIDNATIGGPINFRYFIFKQDVSLTNSRFTHNVDLSFATFERAANFSGTEFQGETRFRAAQAKCDFEITRAKFLSEASFMDLHVYELLKAEGAQFGGEGAYNTYFDRAQIMKNALFCPYDKDNEFIPVRFNGNAHFPGVHILGNAKFEAAQFKGRVDFELAKIGGDASFTPMLRDNEVNPVFFYKEARFLGTHFESNAEFDGAHFIRNANFELARIDKNAHFRQYIKYKQDTRQKWVGPIVFHGEAKFLNMHVSGTANFSGAQFRGRAIFAHVQCDSPAYFSDRLQETGSGPSRFAKEAHFQSARFERQADFRDVSFIQEAKFDRAEIKGAALFQGATFYELACFKDAQFKVASFREPTRAWTKQFHNVVNMTGFTYERIEVDVKELLDGLKYKHADVESLDPSDDRLNPYHRQPYTQLQKSLRALGDDRTADEVYLEQRDRQYEQLQKRVRSSSQDLEERRESRGRLSYLSDWLQRHLFNYGIRPLRLLGMSLGVILIGSFIFWMKGSVVLKEKPAPTSAVEKPPSEKPVTEAEEDLSYTQALGVSFNQFIPIVEIPSGSRWKPSTKLLPKMNLGFLSFAFYGSLHRLAGFILVPLGVAALAGMLQRKEKPGK